MKIFQNRDLRCSILTNFDNYCLIKVFAKVCWEWHITSWKIILSRAKEYCFTPSETTIQTCTFNACNFGDFVGVEHRFKGVKLFERLHHDNPKTATTVRTNALLLPCGSYVIGDINSKRKRIEFTYKKIDPTRIIPKAPAIKRQRVFYKNGKRCDIVGDIVRSHLWQYLDDKRDTPDPILYIKNNFVKETNFT